MDDSWIISQTHTLTNKHAYDSKNSTLKSHSPPLNLPDSPRIHENIHAV